MIRHDETTALIPADALLLFALVTDVTRTPQWSREVIHCEWLDGATQATVGARFAARNKRRWLTWTNRPVVTVVQAGEQFAFRRTERGGGTIEWFWRFEPSTGGTVVTLGYDVHRDVPAMLHLILRAFFGVRELRADLHDNMNESLRRLAAVAAQDCRAVPG